MEDIEPTDGFQDSGIPRRSTHLPSVQTTLATKPSQRLQRPRHVATQLREGQGRDEGAKMKRQASKGRLLGIFGRARSAKGGRTATEEDAEAGDGIIHQEEDDPGQLGHAPVIARNDSSVAVDFFSEAGTTVQQPSNAKRSKSFRTRPISTKPVPWDPPPLFQAYPQSVKHATLCAPAISADTILRIQSDGKRKPKRKNNHSGPVTTNPIDGERKEVKDHGQEVLQLADWSQKIYVLVTSGYMLQYAGEGSFDRLPEKIMPIGKDSAAFASDAIPGKHWVLQVSHTLDENGACRTETSWSFFKRLGLGGNMRKCSASNFLLVLDSPKELDAWLNVVRREIESWGGIRYQADTVIRPNGDGVVRSLHQRPSRRYLVKKDPHQFSNSTSEPTAMTGLAMAETMPDCKSSTTTKGSVHSPSVSNATTSTDQHILDRLKRSPHMSYVSMSAKTCATSGDSSPVLLPTKQIAPTTDHLDMVDKPLAATNQAVVQDISQKQLDHAVPSVLSAPSSTVRSPGQTPSAGAPNFSVPSFSKRYSSAHSTPPLSTASSSSANNLPRKSASPVTIEEQHDGSTDIAVAVEELLNQDCRLSVASSAESMDRNTFPILDKAKPTTHDSTLQAPSSDRVVPRRFSSLEYSRGISPISLRSTPSQAPHPPPTAVLPSLPESSNNSLDVPARTLRRPVSMVVHHSALPSSSATQQHLLPLIFSLTGEDNDALVPPPSRVPPPPPQPYSSNISSPQGLLSPTKALNRRSMPYLSQPPTSPPQCPLPTPPVPKLPPIKLSSGSLRRSVERPLRAGLEPPTPGLVEGVET
ncbi:MAG: hypothetical protein Q9201_003517 [Fulgogasparrea decipioides]